MIKITTLFQLSFSTILLSCLVISQASAQLDCPTDSTPWSSVPGGAESTTGETAESYYQNNWLCGLSEMTKQLSTVTLSSTMAVGTLFDGQNHIQSQTKLSELKAIAHKDYRPSEQICRITSLGKTLASNEFQSDRTLLMVNQLQLARDVGAVNTGGDVKFSRAKQFEDIYCDFNQNGVNGLVSHCKNRDNSTVNPYRLDRDIDYTRIIDNNNTLNINFEDGAISDDETDILALSRLLYMHHTVHQPDITQLQSAYAPYAIADQRALLAKIAVARNSFNHIVAMKSAGSPNANPYLKEALFHLLPNRTEPNYASKFIGNNPSYDAQMNVLTKKIYQDPAFYRGLIESPANVKRQKASMSAIKLMQDRDFLEAMLRREMMLSVLLEVKVSENAALKNPKFFNSSLVDK